MDRKKGHSGNREAGKRLYIIGLAINRFYPIVNHGYQDQIQAPSLASASWIDTDKALSSFVHSGMKRKRRTKQMAKHQIAIGLMMDVTQKAKSIVHFTGDENPYHRLEDGIKDKLSTSFFDRPVKHFHPEYGAERVSV